MIACTPNSDSCISSDGDGRIAFPPANATKSPIMLISGCNAFRRWGCLARGLTGGGCGRGSRRLARLCLQRSHLPFESDQAIFQVTDLLFERARIFTAKGSGSLLGARKSRGE